MKTEAAVLVELGAPIEVVNLEIPALKLGQVLVEMLVSGVCHTQVLESRGYRGQDRFLPHCLGHEASAIVRELGPGVAKVKAGDRVIVSWMKGSGLDGIGTQYRWGARTVNAGGVTTFSRLSVVSENRLVKMPSGIDENDAAAVGCALATGLGAVFNVARLLPGHSVAVFGVGRIGLSAILGAVVSGGTPVIAIDVNDEKLAIAGALGATHAFQSDEAVDRILRTCPGGVDVAIEASGRPDLMVNAMRCVRAQGGTAVVVGNARHGELMNLDPKELNLGKRLLGTWGGDNMPDRDFPRYCQLLKAGRISLASIPPTCYHLEQINEAIDDLEQGRVVRPLIAFDGVAG
jgi:S-(hydroxymethyl)glutathione dehydrogenase/alcohol dehydrogenase